MKKIIFLFAGASLLLGACSDNDNAGNGGNNGSDDIRTVFVKSSDIKQLPGSLSVDEVVFYVEYGTADSRHALVDTRWQNGFTMALPETVSSTYLSSINSIINLPEGEQDNVTISNSGAMVTKFTEFELFNDNKTVGYVYVSGNEDNWYIRYMYSDRDVNVKGTREEGVYKDTYNLELKKGWNRVAETQGENLVEGVTHYTYEIKTDLPSKLDWKYVADEDNARP